MEARCPVCGRVYDIDGSSNPKAMEGHFLKHKDSCTVPRPGDLVRAFSNLARVVEVDGDSEEYPLVEVEYASGRRGVYRLSALGRVADPASAETRFRGTAGG